jgi:hypothetical protein
MTPTERAHAWQQHITDWKTSGVSGSACRDLVEQAKAYHDKTGQRCNIDLVPALIGKEGRRVEADVFGRRVRFNVAKSSGWMPSHLEMKNSRSTFGGALYADEVSNVRVIR